MVTRVHGIMSASDIERGRTMSFFDKLGETIVNVGKDATQKAKDLSGVAKLNLDIKAKEDYVQRQYTELGRIYYEEHKTESEVDGAEHFELIKEALEEIERMKLEIMELRGTKTCPKCGAELADGAEFCSCLLYTSPSPRDA